MSDPKRVGRAKNWHAACSLSFNECDGNEFEDKVMRSCAIKIPLIAPIAVECVFWAEDAGWKGVCESLSILVWGRDFEESKKNMETVLKTYVQSLFREPRKAA